MIREIFEELKQIDKSSEIFSSKELDDIANVLISDDSETKKKDAIIALIERSGDKQ